LEKNIKDSELPDFFFNHMAGMILEEPPTTGEELYSLISDFILNGYKVTKDQARLLCDTICKTLLSQKLISTENKFSLVAEKLLQPVTLNEVKLREEKDGGDGFTDTFLGNERI